jgi:hypothetical protein
VVTPTPGSVAGCGLFPDDNVWNTPVAALPVLRNSAVYVSSIGADTGMHADFGSGLYNAQPIGIPVNVVPAAQPGVRVTFGYSGESDQVAYPIPPDPAIEGGRSSSGDRHILIVRQGECKLYELFAAYPNPDGSWRAGSGATWDLRSNALRPRTWTSADAAGLPILPGLVRRAEVSSGAIHHALRFTAARTQKAFVWPARHHAGSTTDSTVPPMGARFRLRASFDTSGFPKDARVILEALKTYGMILADNGSNWFLSGAPDEAWDNDALRTLRRVKGSDFEAVDSSSLIVSEDSGAVRTK